MFSNKHLSFAACALLLVAACKKDNTQTDTTDLDYSAATDNSKADDAFNDIQVQADNAVSANNLKDLNDGCTPVVTFDTIAVPHTITIDFGNTDCTANNGRLRRGKIIVTYTGHYRDPGTVITITPQNYYVNDIHVQGTKTVTNMGLDGNGHLYFNIQVDGTLTAADNSWTSEHHATRVRTWIEGSSTQDRSDDVYLITGGGHGVNRHGVNYTTQITNALRVAVSCPFITQGTIVITPENKPSRTIDYGNGVCDGTITITVNGHTFSVTIL